MLRRLTATTAPRRLLTLSSHSQPRLLQQPTTTTTTAIAATQPSARRAYHEKVLDHYSSPRNVGSLPKSDSSVGTGLVGAPACGDVMKLQIRVDPSTERIEEVKFKTFGCGSAIASSSYLTELVRGMTLSEAGKVRNTEIARELCLPPVNSMLAEDAIKSAISNWYTKNPKVAATDLGATGAAMPKVEVETVMDGTVGKGGTQSATA
ncbi:MAG: hypothetical protein Q9214_003547 [Letrouitia sp. 1 TL-2023]